MNITLTKFVKRQQTSDALLCAQRGVYDKARIGYNTNVKQKALTNILNKSKPTRCHFCMKFGHMVHQCYYKKTISQNNLRWVPKRQISSSKSNMAWIPEETFAANPKGPKMTWVPKHKT